MSSPDPSPLKPACFTERKHFAAVPPSVSAHFNVKARPPGPPPERRTADPRRQNVPVQVSLDCRTALSITLAVANPFRSDIQHLVVSQMWTQYLGIQLVGAGSEETTTAWGSQDREGAAACAYAGGWPDSMGKCLQACRLDRSDRCAGRACDAPCRGGWPYRAPWKMALARRQSRMGMKSGRRPSAVSTPTSAGLGTMVPRRLRGVIGPAPG